MIIHPDKGHYGALYDANGVRIFCPYSADTETGEVVKLVEGPDGKPVWDPVEGHNMMETAFFPAPLTFVPGDPRHAPDVLK